MRALSYTSIWLLLQPHQNAASASASDMDYNPQPAPAQQPLGVRKMTSNEDEMFFLSYWRYDPLEFRADHSSSITNSTSPLLSPALPPHSSNWNLFKRAWQCPTGTSPCTSINQPNSCCSASETCILVTDTGLGPVGCCPSGQSCAGAVAPCNTAQGYSSCQGSPNGGCCIPGYACQGVGCVLTGTTSVAGSSSTSTPSTSTTTVVVGGGQSVSVETQTIAVIESASQITVTQTSTLTLSGSNTPVAPVRPTSDTTTLTLTSASPTGSTNPPSSTTTTATTSTTTLPPTTTTEGETQCPTNFYRCSAFYASGACCRVGRDCSSTSCPPLASSTYTTDGHATVVIVTSGAACANGWSSCPAFLGGGCCPSGYGCGVATCTATAPASSGAGRRWEVRLMSGVVVGVVWGLYWISI